MARISFNKGKKFFNLNSISSKDKNYIISKMNDKIWNNIIDKMDDITLINIINNFSALRNEKFAVNDKEHRYIVLQTYLNNANKDLIL